MLHVPGKRPRAVGAQGELEAELAVGTDEWRGQDFAEGDAVGEVFREAEVEGLERELSAALVGGAAGEHGAMAVGRE